MDNLIGVVTSISAMGIVPFAAFQISRFVDRFIK